MSLYTSSQFFTWFFAALTSWFFIWINVNTSACRFAAAASAAAAAPGTGGKKAYRFAGGVSDRSESSESSVGDILIEQGNREGSSCTTHQM
ncbi:hypothetical protein FPV67DRAFT_1478360 [Lyophyllum atratum]|nr:hypothetical protein FPV67DRAFT_1478360 [Lyophyllum atratum]